MLEGEVNAFQFHFKQHVTTNRMKVISQTKNQEPLAHQSQFAKLTLEGEGDTFWFHFKCQVTTNRMKVISQTKNQELLAHQSQLC
jgi:hypothetical protein